MLATVSESESEGRSVRNVSRKMPGSVVHHSEAQRDMSRSRFKTPMFGRGEKIEKIFFYHPAAWWTSSRTVASQAFPMRIPGRTWSPALIRKVRIRSFRNPLEGRTLEDLEGVALYTAQITTAENEPSKSGLDGR